MPTHSSSAAPRAPSHSATAEVGAPHWDDETLPLRPKSLPPASQVNHTEVAADEHAPPAEFDVSDITRISPPEPPPDATFLPELRTDEVESRREQPEKPARRPLRAVLYLTLGILVGFLTHKGPTLKHSTDGRKSAATESSLAAKVKSAPTHEVAKAALPASQPGLPPLPEHYDPKDADTTAAAQAIAIGDYPTALRHYHALSQAHPDAEVFKVIVNVLRKRIQVSTKNE